MDQGGGRKGRGKDGRRMSCEGRGEGWVEENRKRAAGCCEAKVSRNSKETGERLSEGEMERGSGGEGARKRVKEEAMDFEEEQGRQRWEQASEPAR